MSQERSFGKPSAAWGPSLRQVCSVFRGLSEAEESSVSGFSIWLLASPHFLSHELVVVCVQEEPRDLTEAHEYQAPQTLSGLTSVNCPHLPAHPLYPRWLPLCSDTSPHTQGLPGRTPLWTAASSVCLTGPPSSKPEMPLWPQGFHTQCLTTARQKLEEAGNGQGWQD